MWCTQANTDVNPTEHYQGSPVGFLQFLISRQGSPPTPVPVSSTLRIYHTWGKPSPSRLNLALSEVSWPLNSAMCLHDALQLPTIKGILCACGFPTLPTMPSSSQLQDAFLSSQNPVTSDQGCLSQSFTLPAAALCSSVQNLHPIALRA